MKADTSSEIVQGLTKRELRLGVSFSGGVSLAVWMGGVAAEMQAMLACRQSHEAGNVYETLCSVTATDPVIDVVAGTSAGGINGSALALALAKGGDVSALRDMWIDEGDLSHLLRPLTESHPPSLLRGDEVLGAKLLEGLEQVSQRPGAAQGRVRLTVPVTLMTPRPHLYTDALGQEVVAHDHLGLLRFGENDLRGPHAVEALAAAARASASYPVGFEPADVRAVMGPKAGWALDGGLLLNEPLGPVLEDVIDHPARRSVRRVVMQVSPSPDRPTDSADRPDRRPDLRQVLVDTVRIPWQQHLAQEYAEVAAHNARVGEQKARRRLISARLRSGGPDAAATAEEITEEVAEATRVLAQRFAARVMATDGPGRQRLLSAGRPDPEMAGLTHYREAQLLDSSWVPSTVREAAFAVLDHIRSQERSLCETAAAENGIPQPTDQQVAGEEEGNHKTAREAMGTVISSMNRLENQEIEAWAAWLVGTGPPEEKLRGYRREVAEATEKIRSSAEEVGLPIDDDLLAEFALLAAAAGGPRRAQAVELIQLSAHAWSCVKDKPRSLADLTAPDSEVLSRPEQKLKGLEMFRFAAFQKRSWRANDWMWGRMDAAAHLIPLLTDIERLRALHGTRWHEALAKALGDLGELPAAVSKELAEGPDAIPMTQRWLISLRQHQILEQELPVLAAAIRADEAGGGGHDAASQLAEAQEQGRDLGDVVAAYRMDEQSIAQHRRTPAGAENERGLMAVAAAATVGVLPRALRPVPWVARWALVVRAALSRLRGRRHSARQPSGR